MYRHNEKQLQFESFKLPFSGKLRSDNRWVKLAKQIPWPEIEALYSSSLSLSGKGAPALSVRVAFGAMVIKEKLGLSDEVTVEQIRENPYLQYFLGLKRYEDKSVFHPTMFVVTMNGSKKRGSPFSAIRWNFAPKSGSYIFTVLTAKCAN